MRLLPRRQAFNLHHPSPEVEDLKAACHGHFAQKLQRQAARGWVREQADGLLIYQIACCIHRWQFYANIVHQNRRLRGGVVFGKIIFQVHGQECVARHQLRSKTTCYFRPAACVGIERNPENLLALAHAAASGLRCQRQASDQHTARLR